MEQAVRASPGGVLLDVEVMPGAKGSAFPAGFNPWRARIQARVAAPPEGGRANAELLLLVAAFFGVGASAVRLVAGATDRRKTIRVAGLAAEAALRRLAEAP